MGASILALTACSLLVDSNESACAIDSDCTARGTAFAGARCEANRCVSPALAHDAWVESGQAAEDAGSGPWRCAGSIKWGGADPTRSLLVTLPFWEYLQSVPATGLLVKTCALADLECSVPASQGLTNAAGVVSLSTYAGFDGFFLATPMGSDDWFPTIVRVLPPPLGDINIGNTAAEHSDVLSTIVLSNIGQTLDPERGHLVVQAVDCDGALAPGVVITVASADSASFRFYTRERAPAIELTSTTVTTDSPEGEAFGGYTNLPVGNTEVVLTLASTNQVVARARAPIRKGTLTTFTIPPTPL